MDNKLEYAWIQSEGKVYAASTTREEAKSSGRSPIIKLIEGIYFTESFSSQSQARHLLRERIHFTYSPSITDRETVKVAAKRLAHSVEEFHEAPSALRSAPVVEPFLDSKLKLGEWIDPITIPDVLERLRMGKEDSDRSVSALLVDSSDHILGWSWNTNAVIRTRHAEWNLCAGLMGKIPFGARLWVSLKPCRMCAARIWEQSEDPTKITVIYLEDDPGPFAQGTMLDADSPARLRYLGPRDPRIGIEIQSPVKTIL